MKTSVYTALLTFLAVGSLLGIFGFLMNRQILLWLHTPDNIIAAAGTYLGIYFLGMPFLFMYNILSSMFNSLGDSRTPLFLLIFSSVLNVFLDHGSYGFGMDWRGWRSPRLSPGDGGSDFVFAVASSERV
ncbi:MAG: MATE family efflux transporter [Eisenbergiella sp.]